MSTPRVDKVEKNKLQYLEVHLHICCPPDDRVELRPMRTIESLGFIITKYSKQVRVELEEEEEEELTH